MSDATAELSAVLETAAAEFEDVVVGGGTDVHEWAIGGIVFAAAGPDGAEFRLAPPVASAALRTPDTLPSRRGADWVLFRPATLDGHAIDRATAWLASAWRRADGET